MRVLNKVERVVLDMLKVSTPSNLGLCISVAFSWCLGHHDLGCLPQAICFGAPSVLLALFCCLGCVVVLSQFAFQTSRYFLSHAVVLVS